MYGIRLFWLLAIAGVPSLVAWQGTRADHGSALVALASPPSGAETLASPTAAAISAAQANEDRLIIYHVIQGDAQGAPPASDLPISKRTFTVMLQRALDLSTCASTTAAQTSGTPYYLPAAIAVNAYSHTNVLSGNESDNVPIHRIDAVALALRLSIARHVIAVGALPATFPKFADEDKIPKSKLYEAHLAAYLNPSLVGIDDNFKPYVNLNGLDAITITSRALNERLATKELLASHSSTTGIGAPSAGVEDSVSSSAEVQTACR